MARLTRWTDKFQQVTEYLISAAFIISAASLISAEPLEGKGLIVLIFGGHIALFIYMIWFFILGFGLIYAKVRKHKKLHKNFLLAIYLTCIYTSILTFYLIGFIGIIDDVVIGGLAAFFWIRWKFKTEYLRPGKFYIETLPFRDDLPPPTP